MKKGKNNLKIISGIVITLSLLVSVFIIAPNNVKGFLLPPSGWITVNGPWLGTYYGNWVYVLPGCSINVSQPPACLQYGTSSRGGLNSGSGTGTMQICLRYAVTQTCPPPPPPPPPNQAPTVTYTGTTSIGYTTAIANWSYSDPEGDPQVQSAVQIATDPGYTNFAWGGYGGSANNLAIPAVLKQGTTYYPRVAVYNAVNGWTGYVNGPAFTTLANNPPNLGEFSCSGTPTGYNTAQVNWNYTGSDPDALELTLKYIKLGDPAWTSVNLPGNRTGTQNIASLIPGETYAVRIEVIDEYNTPLRGDWVNRWKDCGNVRANPYPEPGVVFNLNGGGNTVSSGGTLTVNTGEEINVNWDITNTDGVEVSTCRMTTSGGPQQIFNINPLGSLKDGKSNTPAANLNDQTYVVRLECAGKTPANPVRNIDRTINVFIRSRPVVSCSTTNRVVTSKNSKANIIAEVTNAIGPIWGISKNGNGGYTTIGKTGNNITTEIEYTGLGFGKYNPWIQVSASNGVSTVSCGQISNLGNRFIREIAP